MILTLPSNAVEIEPGLYQFTLPIPIKSLGSVFAYFAFDGKRNLLIDTGWSSPEAYEALDSSLASIGFSISQVEKIVVSHLHPDHFGLVGEIKNHSTEAIMLMHHADAITIKKDQKDYVDFVVSLHEWLRIHGAPDQEFRSMLEASLELAKSFKPVRPDIEVFGGEQIHVGDKWNFEIISTPGHTQGNICLYEKGKSRIFFSGDHILPTITPNVSLTPSYEGDPLGDYLHSLEMLKDYKVSKVLPSHEFIFTDLKKRIGEIENHHKDRLASAIKALDDHAEGLSAYEVATKLDWYTGSWEKLSAWERRAAMMETLAHLEYLKRKGNVTEIQSRAGNEERILYANFDDCN